jgi:tryptophanyl-tRNA synthetase
MFNYDAYGESRTQHDLGPIVAVVTLGHQHPCALSGNFTSDTLPNMKDRVFSGVQPTGQLHIGNYYGAIKGMLELQRQVESLFCVVDLHALTTPKDYSQLPENIRNVALDYLAAGLDPEQSIIFVQSHVKAHVELMWLLGVFVPVAWLEHLPTYKDKKAQHPDFVNWGLLSYPVLMAADILLYKANQVPVGIDQEPHLEIAREIARKFNRQFGYDFPEPKIYKTQGEYVPSLTGEGKMSKSVEGSFIALSDNLETIQKKLAKAPTDTGSESEMSQGTQNLFKLMELFSQPDTVQSFREARQNGTIRYGDMKKQLADDIFAELQPIQENRRELAARSGYIDEVLQAGAAKARQLAEPTLSEVKQLLGLA